MLGPITPPQAIVFGVLLLVLALFISGRWRYDVVALLALLAVTITGIVPGDEVFAGFGHPAVVTVAAVLVVSRGLQNSGLIEVIARLIARVSDQPMVQMATLVVLVALFSGFMNNVGALALLMPVAIQIAYKRDLPPSRILMPLAFASLLGGMTTLIGTPPNIIIATFRADYNAEPFAMFDFLPVGAGLVVVGLVYMLLVGWRLIPQRKGRGAHDEMFAIEDYLTEVLVSDESKLVGKPIREINRLAETDVMVVGIVRGRRRRPAPSPYELIAAGDQLIVRADSEELEALVKAAGLELVGSKELAEADLKSDEVALLEVVVTANSFLEGKTARSLNLRRRFGINLLAIARQGARLGGRLNRTSFRAGDVLLIQAVTDTLPEALATLGILPLAGRELRLGQPRRIALALAIFGGALAATALGLLPVQVSFTAAALVMVIVGLLSLREAYESIDWPIIMLLGGIIPVGQALETTGGAALLADQLLRVANQLAPAVTLVILLVGTMFLSDVVNNAAAALLMAPIAAGLAHGLGVSVDPFLMGVAVGASCAFLTPIGHQSNTLVMGPGGYRFGDYWRMGLPLEALIVIAGVPLILWFWPL
ncbi:MAG: SLC13 family permease [Chloroflexi bacterium]|nr:MAG: SLC13 family permease [Chloroflexota bacterium]